jgi:hypothetical protein
MECLKQIHLLLFIVAITNVTLGMLRNIPTYRRPVQTGVTSEQGAQPQFDMPKSQVTDEQKNKIMNELLEDEQAQQYLLQNRQSILKNNFELSQPIESVQKDIQLFNPDKKEVIIPQAADEILLQGKKSHIWDRVKIIDFFKTGLYNSKFYNQAKSLKDNFLESYKRKKLLETYYQYLSLRNRVLFEIKEKHLDYESVFSIVKYLDDMILAIDATLSKNKVIATPLSLILSVNKDVEEFEIILLNDAEIEDLDALNKSFQFLTKKNQEELPLKKDINKNVCYYSPIHKCIGLGKNFYKSCPSQQLMTLLHEYRHHQQYIDDTEQTFNNKNLFVIQIKNYTILMYLKPLMKKIDLTNGSIGSKMQMIGQQDRYVVLHA